MRRPVSTPAEFLWRLADESRLGVLLLCLWFSGGVSSPSAAASEAVPDPLAELEAPETLEGYPGEPLSGREMYSLGPRPAIVRPYPIRVACTVTCKPSAGPVPD